MQQSDCRRVVIRILITRTLNMEVDVLSSAAQELVYDHITSEQQLHVVVESFVKGQDVLVSLPTGSGKSLC